MASGAVYWFAMGRYVTTRAEVVELIQTVNPYIADRGTIQQSLGALIKTQEELSREVRTMAQSVNMMAIETSTLSVKVDLLQDKK